MRLLHSFSSVLSLVFLASSLFVTTAFAAEGRHVRIVRVVGSGAASVLVNGQATPLAEGMELGVNDEIVTEAKEVYVEVDRGVVATVRPNSRVRVDTLGATQSVLHLRSGSLVSQIDKKRGSASGYSVRTARGVAAARGTSFTVSDGPTGMTIMTTADSVSFTSAAGSVEIKAGLLYYTPTPGAEPTIVPLASAASNPAVAEIISSAVQTASTVVQNNLGNISADSATDILSQVVAVAAGALPARAGEFVSTAVGAATAAGSATGGTSDTAALAAGAITAAAVSAAPQQAASIAGAAAQAAPAQAGVIAAVAQQVAPGASEAIVQSVAASTGQSAATIQSSANAAAGQANAAVNSARESLNNIVAPASDTGGPAAAPEPEPDSEQPVAPEDITPQTPVDPTINVSPAS